MISKNVIIDLNQIREIRNKFAHNLYINEFQDKTFLIYFNKINYTKVVKLRIEGGWASYDEVYQGEELYKRMFVGTVIRLYFVLEEKARTVERVTRFMTAQDRYT